MKKLAIFHPFLFLTFFSSFILSYMAYLNDWKNWNFSCVKAPGLQQPRSCSSDCWGVDCYVGMGGNFINTLPVMQRIITLLKNQIEIQQFRLSRLYQTSPISDIPQPPYLNAVCRFQTDMPLNTLWQLLQHLEKMAGKKPKAKNSPRLIDLDLLFYGPMVSVTEELTIPHPRWHERLFVLAPLADVTDVAPLKRGKRLQEIIERFPNPHQEIISVLSDRLEDAKS